MAGIVRTKAMPVQGKGMTSLFHYMNDGTIVHESQNDVTAILEANKYQQSEQSMRHESEVYNHVARIDTIAIQNWCKARGMGRGWYREFMTNEKLLTEFLNDPDNKVWRTRLGKI